MNYIESGSRTVALLCIAAATFPHPAIAQQSDASGAKFDDIIVTARKTGEAEQSLPITIAAFSGEELTNKVVLNIQDMQSVVPGLNVSTNYQGDAPTFAIRGTATANLVDGGVAVYFGDVPVVSTITIANAFYDIASVEILKGPQGTQFGTNTTGGTITVRPNSPSDEFEGYIKAGYGKFKRREFEGMINLPASDVLKFRLAGNLVKRDGFVRNPIAEGTIPHRFWDEDHYSFRASMRMETDMITSDIVFDYYRSDETGIPNIPVLFTDPGGNAAANPANLGAQLGARRTVFVGPDPSGSQREYFIDAKLWGVQHVLNVEVSDSVSLRNVVGYRKDFNDASQNNGGTSLALINVLTRDWKDQWIDDLTLRFNLLGGRLHANIGAFHLEGKRNQGIVANAGQGAFLAATGLPLVANIRVFSSRKLKSQALYGNIDFDLTDRLTVVGGARYNWDSGRLRFSSTQAFGLPDVGDNFRPDAANPCNPAALAGFPAEDRDLSNCFGRRAGKWSAASWNVGVNYHLNPRALLYAKVSHGYLAGGFNTTIREIPTFEPEKNTQFEAGAKADWLLGGRPIRTNIAGYYGKIRNKQVVQNTNYDDGGSGNGVFNAAKETVYGTDFEIQFSPFEGMTLEGNYSYIHAEFDEFSFPAIGGPGPTLTPAQDLSGNTPARVPKHQVNIGASYALPLPPGTGQVTATLSAYGTSGYPVFDIDRTLDFGPEFNTIDSYWLINASLKWEELLGSPVSAHFWVQNLFDKQYAVGKDPQFSTFGYANVRFGAPRTFGVTGTFEF